MSTIYLYKYHVAYKNEHEDKETSEGFVFATDYSTACEELRKMYGPYITKLYMKEAGRPDCYVFETKTNGEEVTDRWY